ncbi:MAG: hypothetical protein AAGU75_00395 [Bacillota bacterium]
MKSLDEFKEFMAGSKVPNYVRRYCEDLDEFKWQWFYLQMKEPIEFVADVDYLFYILKWILKSNFDDLGYEVYFQSVMNPEMHPEPLIKDEWWSILQKSLRAGWLPREESRKQNKLLKKSAGLM